MQWLIHRNKLQHNSNRMLFHISTGSFFALALCPHLQHFFFSTCRTLLQRGHVWYASLKFFMKKGIRQQHRTNPQQMKSKHISQAYIPGL